MEKFPFFLLFHLLPPIIGLTLYSGSKMRELPEYSEYLRKLGLTNNATITSTLPTTSSTAIIATHPSARQIQTFFPIPQFPLVEICKQSPTDLYGHVICWSLLALYILLIISLIIYQLRSYFWLRNNRRNGQHNNKENFKLKSFNEQGLQRLFSLRSLTPSDNIAVPSGPNN